MEVHILHLLARVPVPNEGRLAVGAELDAAAEVAGDMVLPARDKVAERQHESTGKIKTAFGSGSAGKFLI